MNASSGKKALLGALLWIAAAVGVAAAVAGLEPATRRRLDHVKVEMARAVFDPAPTYTIFFPEGTVLERENGVLALVHDKLVRVGEVVRVRREGDGPMVERPARATIAIDDRAGGFRPRAGSIGVRRSQGASFVFALKTLVPAARWKLIQAKWADFRASHQEALERELEPLASELVAAALRGIAAALPEALARHQDELAALGTRMREGLGREQVVPLLTEALWPIVMKHAAEPAEAIGRELWERVPLMSFALRAAADRLLEDEPVRVEQRWRQFVEEEALPTLRAHRPETEEALRGIVRDVLASEDVQARTAAVWHGVKSDPQVQALVRTLVRELLVENPHLNAELRALSQDPKTRAHVTRLGESFQEFFDPLGELLLLDESGKGINPDLAYLIRLLLLQRDAQLVYLEGGEGEPGDQLEPGSEIPGRSEP